MKTLKLSEIAGMLGQPTPAGPDRVIGGVATLEEATAGFRDSQRQRIGPVHRHLLDRAASQPHRFLYPLRRPVSNTGDLERCASESFRRLLFSVIGGLECLDEQIHAIPISHQLDKPVRIYSPNEFEQSGVVLSAWFDGQFVAM